MRLTEHVQVVVWFATDRNRVVSYSIVLLTLYESSWQTIRVYDNAHGQNEMHRHTLRGGKQSGEVFSQAGDFGDAMRSAREEVLAGYEKMIEGWRR